MEKYTSCKNKCFVFTIAELRLTKYPVGGKTQKLEIFGLQRLITPHFSHHTTPKKRQHFSIAKHQIIQWCKRRKKIN
jgi:hypothetical protein